jgi:hypothetical protein
MTHVPVNTDVAAGSSTDAGSSNNQLHLPPTHFVDGQEVLYVTRKVSVDQQHAVKVIRVKYKFFAWRRNILNKGVRRNWLCLIAPLAGAVCASILVTAFAHMYLEPPQHLWAILFVASILVIAGNIIIPCIRWSRSVTDREIDVLYRLYDLEPNVGKVYGDPDALNNTDTIIVPK